MANIYSMNAEYLTEGMQGCTVCDEAIQAAKMIANERDEDVMLEDDDGNWIVHPDGSREEAGPEWDDPEDD